MENYYVVLRRWLLEKDYVSLYTEEEARAKNWITDSNSRVWVVPIQNETTPTFVWKFDDLEQAMTFYDTLLNNEIGVDVEKT